MVHPAGEDLLEFPQAPDAQGAVVLDVEDEDVLELGEPSPKRLRCKVEADEVIIDVDMKSEVEPDESITLKIESEESDDDSGTDLTSTGAVDEAKLVSLLSEFCEFSASSSMVDSGQSSSIAELDIEGRTLTYETDAGAPTRCQDSGCGVHVSSTVHERP